MEQEKRKALEQGPVAYFYYYCNMMFSKGIMEGRVDCVSAAKDVKGALNRFVAEHREQFVLAATTEYLEESKAHNSP